MTIIDTVPFYMLKSDIFNNVDDNMIDAMFLLKNDKNL